MKAVLPKPAPFGLCVGVIMLALWASLAASPVSAQPARAAALPAIPASPQEWDVAGQMSGRSATARRANARTVSATSAWGWSNSARNWTRSTRVLPPVLIARGPAATINRATFIRSLYTLEAWRNARYRTGRTLATTPSGAVLSDVAVSSIFAKAVKLGWISPVKGAFVPSRRVTANEAAIGMVSVLGLRPTAVLFGRKMQQEIPGVRGPMLTYASQNIIRNLGLRFNVLENYDRLELGPNEALNVAHGAYMLRAAATVDSWRLDAARALPTSFDLPKLGANQGLLLNQAVRLLGQPYIWGGISEGRQAQGHGGFDCSGFMWRLVRNGPVAVANRTALAERTTYTMSAMPASRRIKRASLRPGDLMFFGERGPRSTPGQNYHVGMYMGNDWFIHSSGGNGGVAIDTLNGWWAGQYSWGRRVLKRA